MRQAMAIAGPRQTFLALDNVGLFSTLLTDGKRN